MATSMRMIKLKTSDANGLDSVLLPEKLAAALVLSGQAIEINQTEEWSPRTAMLAHPGGRIGVRRHAVVIGRC